MTNPYAFKQLRLQRLAKSTRPFLARGILQTRCPNCQIAQYACICDWKKTTKTQLDIVLLMHTDEILKPTNTGHLISDVLPEQCFSFEWSRTEPSPDLLNILTDPKRQIIILYPASEERESYTGIPETLGDKILTLVVIDGTWRQSKKIFNLSEWLQTYPVLTLAIAEQANYGLRKAKELNQLSTAEACALALAQCNEINAAKILQAYFTVFNHHYSATRLCKQPEAIDEYELLKK